MNIDPAWTIQQTTAAVTEALRQRWGDDRLKALTPRIALLAGWLQELSRHPVPALGPEPDFLGLAAPSPAAGPSEVPKVVR